MINKWNWKWNVHERFLRIDPQAFSPQAFSQARKNDPPKSINGGGPNKVRGWGKKVENNKRGAFIWYLRVASYGELGIDCDK